MGCTRLGTDFLFFLEIETSEERARTQKKDLNVYPFGLKHKGYNDTPIAGQRDHKYGFGGKEEQSELGLEWMDFHARNYDAALGRWMNIDPLAEKFHSWSPFNYVYNSPLKFVDPTGMGAETVQDDYIFDSEGIYTGKKIKNGLPNRAIIQNEQGVTTAIYKLNDPVADGASIEEGLIKTIVVVPKDKIDKEIATKKPAEGESVITYFEREGRPFGNKSVLSGKSKGELDFASTSDLVSGHLNVPEGSNVAYNINDFGNFLIGRAASSLGLSLSTVSNGAHLNNFLNGKTDNPGVDTGIFDSPGDQKAIRAGYYYPRNIPKQKSNFISPSDRFARPGEF